MTDQAHSSLSRGFTPTEEQLEIVSAVRAGGHLMTQAYAGTAKTTTIELASPEVRGSALAMAFNKKIAEELERRLPGNFVCKTANGLGHGAWARSRGGARLELDDRKVGRLVKDWATSRGIRRLPGDEWEGIRELVSRAQTRGILPGRYGQGLEPDDEETWKDLLEPGESQDFIPPAREVLEMVIEEAKKGKISFDDQIYCSVLLGGVFPKFETVVVDEAQDLSPLNHAMVRKVLRAGGRVIQVGDPKQAIYGFRGADHQSMGSLKRAIGGDWGERKLTMTFRCPKEIVARQQGHAPGFRAAEGNRQGMWSELGLRDLDDSVSWDWGLLARTASGVGTKDIAILCRNNGPILKLALAFIRQGVAPVVLGRDLLKSLIKLSRKIFPDDSTPRDLCLGLIQEWGDSEVRKFRDEEAPKAAGVRDRQEALAAVASAEGVRDASGVRAALERLASRDSGEVTLSTIHRAKGLEWDVVVHLDPWRVPSKWAKRAAKAGDRRQLEQEMNLLYVCETRTRNVLLHANAEDFQS